MIIAKLLADGPSDLKPDYGYLPFTSLVKDLVEGFMGMALYLVVGCLVAAALAWIAGKVSSSGAVGKISALVLLWALIGATIIAAAGSLVSWFSGLPIIPQAA